MTKKQAVVPAESLNFKQLYQKEFGSILAKNRSMTPQQVFEMAIKYFQWAESNAIQCAETASYQGEVKETAVFKTRVFTMTGFKLFMGISDRAITTWRNDEDYRDVIEFIDSVINEQKFQLAANGIINASFIGKDLGIDKPAQITIDNMAQAGAVSAASATEDQMKEAVASILDAL